MSSSPNAPTVLLLNLPQKTFVGINLASFNSSPNLHGITNIPPGLHFLYTGTDAGLSIRHGHWVRIRHSTAPQPQTYVFRWNHEHESLDLLDARDDAAIAAARAIPSLQGRGIVDYAALRDANSKLQASQSKDGPSTVETEATAEDDPWPDLTSHLAPRTLSRIMNPSHNQLSTTHAWTLSSISTAPQDTETIPGLSNPEASGILHEAGSSALNFVPINLKQTWPEDSIGRDRTEKARDKSWYLSHLIDSISTGSASTTTKKADSELGTDPAARDRATGAKEMLAELQFCFLMVLTLANYSCLEQWKRLLALLFGCKSALDEVEGFFVEVVSVLRVQLGRVEDVEGGLFEMGDEVGSSWLRHLLAGLRANVDETSKGEQQQTRLKTTLAELENWLQDTYGWIEEGTMLKRGMVDLEDGERVEVQMDGLDEEEESGEYAPVVVEM